METYDDDENIERRMKEDMKWTKYSKKISD